MNHRRRGDEVRLKYIGDAREMNRELRKKTSGKGRKFRTAKLLGCSRIS